MTYAILAVSANPPADTLEVIAYPFITKSAFKHALELLQSATLVALQRDFG